MNQNELARIGRYPTLDAMFANGEEVARQLIKGGYVEPGQRVLDYGAGLGRVAIPLAHCGVEVHCFEPHEPAREYLKGRGMHTVASLREDYDVALCFFVLQHLGLSAARFVLEHISSSAPRLLFTYPTFEQIDRCDMDPELFTPAREMQTCHDCRRSAVLPIAAFNELFRFGGLGGYDLNTCREVRSVSRGKFLMWEIRK